MATQRTTWDPRSEKAAEAVEEMAEEDHYLRTLIEKAQLRDREEPENQS